MTGAQDDGEGNVVFLHCVSGKKALLDAPLALLLMLIMEEILQFRLE
jgi:hypothetical protein